MTAARRADFNVERIFRQEQACRYREKMRLLGVILVQVGRQGTLACDFSAVQLDDESSADPRDIQRLQRIGARERKVQGEARVAVIRVLKPIPIVGQCNIG